METKDIITYLIVMCFFRDSLLEGIMKYFIFRKDENGFQDWIRSIKHFKWAIRTHQAGAKNDKEYREANLWYVNYLAFMKELSPVQKSSLNTKKMGIFFHGVY